MFGKVSEAWAAFKQAHLQADTDTEPNSMHHTLGKGPNQAAPGNHNHDNAYSSSTHNHDAAYAASDHIHIHPYIIRIATANQNINNAALTQVALDTTEASEGVWSPDAAGNVTVPETGLYHVTGHVQWNSSTVGSRRDLEIRVNGNPVGVRQEFWSGGSGSPSNVAASDIFLTAGDLVSLYVYQNCGAVLALTTATPQRLTVRRVDES